MQAGKVFGAVAVEGDAHGDALLYLDKVARGIVDGKEREGAARGTADALHATPIDDTGHGIDGELRLRPFVDMVPTTPSQVAMM